MSLLYLFGLFFYIGLFTIGGGQVAITLMQQSLVDEGIISADIFFNMVAIAESTPGPIGINMATFIGYHFYGLVGGIVTTFGTVLPSLVIIMIIARNYERFMNASLVKRAFTGIRPAVTGLVAVAAFRVWCIALVDSSSSVFLEWFDVKKLIFYVLSFVGILKTKLHPIVFVILGALFGIIFL